LLYLLDANTLIDAKRDYYPMQRVPEFWDWLVHHGDSGNVKIPIEVYEEFSEAADAAGNKDELATWADRVRTKEALVLGEEANAIVVSTVIYTGYMADPTDEEIEQIGRDPFLISYALTDITGRCVVTTETSKPKRRRSNKHIPDVCEDLGVRCINTFGLVNELNFSTDQTKW